MTAKVSVVIPTYNQADWLREALDSVIGQTMGEWEAFVVNNYSDDHTVQVVESYADPRINLINFHNDGIIAASRNQGVERAQAPWIAFLDSDDRWHPRKLERCLEIAKANPDAAVIAHAMNMVYDGRIERQHHAGPPARAQWRNMLFQGTCATPSASLCSTEWLRRVGSVSEDPRYRTVEDYDCWLKLSAAGGRYVFVPDVLTDYRVHSTSASSSIDRHLAASLAVIQDHYARIESPGIGERLLLRRRLGGVMRGAGRKLAATGDFIKALGLYRRSFVQWPSYLTLAAAVLAIGTILFRPFSGLTKGTRFQKIRADIEQVTGDAQERNRMWWERLPMTYASWEAEARTPTSHDDFLESERILLRHSTFLRERFDFAALSGRKVLDIGCGAGILACLMAKHGAKVTAIDLTEQGVTLTRRNAEYQGVDIETRQMDAERMTLPDQSFDMIWSWGVLHHSQRTELTLFQAARVLKAGGRGLIMVYHRRSAVYYLKGLWWLLARGKVFDGHTLASVQDFYIDGYYHRHFTGSELSRALMDVGLRPVRVFACQQEEPLLPLRLPRAWDEALKTWFGWYLVAEFEKPA